MKKKGSYILNHWNQTLGLRLESVPLFYNAIFQESPHLLNPISKLRAPKYQRADSRGGPSGGSSWEVHATQKHDW